MHSTRGESSKAFPPRLYCVLYLTIACFMVLCTWSTYHGVYRHDQYQLINLGQVVYDGGRLYIDCWENKPPGVPWIVTALLWLTHGSQQCVWIFPGVIGFIGIVSLSWSLRKVIGIAESIAISLVASIMFSTRAYDSPSNHPDFYSAMFSLIGTSVFLVALKQPHSTRILSIVAGLSWGCSAISRQTGIIGPAIMVVMALLLSLKKISLAAHYRRVAMISFCMCVTVIGGVIILLWLRGNLEEAYYAIYTFNENLLTPKHFEHAVNSVHKLIQVHGPLGLPLACAFLSVFLLIRRESERALDNLCILGFALWFIVDNWFSLLGPSQIDRYWLSTWTPMLFLAADGLSVVVKKFNALPDGKLRGMLIVAMFMAISLTYPLVERYKNGRYYDGFIASVTQYLTSKTMLTEHGTLHAIGKRVQHIVPEKEKIFVMMYDPGIYLYSRRACAVRFTYPRGVAQQDEILSVLEKGDAFLILVPVDADPGPEWRMSPEGVQRLYQVLNDYRDMGSYLGYQFLIKSETKTQIP